MIKFKINFVLSFYINLYVIGNIKTKIKAYSSLLKKIYSKVDVERGRFPRVVDRIIQTDLTMSDL